MNSIILTPSFQSLDRSRMPASVKAACGMLARGLKFLVFRTLLLAMVVVTPGVQGAPDELVLKLESSSNLQHWTPLNMETLSMRDGKLRVNATFSDKRWFRLKIIDAKSVARAKLMDFRGAGGRPLIPEDYADMEISGAHSTNINQINLAVFDADASVILSQELLQQLVAETAAAAIDLDAVAYARNAGLQGEPLMRLSGFLRDIKKAGIEPAIMYLGRREFLGRSGSTHYAVYGGPATVGSGITQAETGISFTGNASTFLFQTPESVKSAAATGVGMYVVAKRTSSNSGMALLSHSPKAGSDRGPELSGTSTSNAYQTQMAAHALGAANSARATAYACAPEDVFYMPFGTVETQNGSLYRIPGAGLHGDGGSTLSSSTFYHNNASGALGAPLSNTAANRWHGEISFALETAAPLGRTTRYQLLNALCKHKIASLTPPAVVFLVGDSMTVGSAGASPSLSRSSLLFTIRNSGWRGSVWETLAKGGVPIATQEKQYADALERLSLLPDVAPGWIWFWGGYNYGDAWESNAQALAHADRYLAMAADAASRGYKTCHWSAIVSSPNSQEIFDRTQLFNNYYREKIAQLEGDHIYYDHRDTFSEGQFDWNTRNENYFADTIHLTELGQQVLVDDFLSKYPNP